MDETGVLPVLPRGFCPSLCYSVLYCATDSVTRSLTDSQWSADLVGRLNCKVGPLIHRRCAHPWPRHSS